jgi:dual-specificity kinase
MTTMAQDPKARHWEEEFYKNGYPKEVIVIEDSPTPPASSSSVATLRSSSKPPTPDHPHPSQPDQGDLRVSSGQVYNTASAAAAAFYASSKRARPYPTTDDPSLKRTKPSLIRVDQQGIK